MYQPPSERSLVGFPTNAVVRVSRVKLEEIAHSLGEERTRVPTSVRLNIFRQSVLVYSPQAHV